MTIVVVVACATVCLVNLLELGLMADGHIAGVRCCATVAQIVRVRRVRLRQDGRQIAGLRPTAFGVATCLRSLKWMIVVLVMVVVVVVVMMMVMIMVVPI